MLENLDDQGRGGKYTHTERRVLTSGWLPDCMSSDKYDCYGCPLDDFKGCPIDQDGDYRSYLQWLQERYVRYEHIRQQRIKVLKSILKRHKLPLHWEVLAELALRIAPEVFDSQQSVKGLVYFNTDTFFMESEGVFGLRYEPERNGKGV